MKRRKNNIIQLCVLGILGAAVLFTLIFPNLNVHVKRREPLEISAVMRDVDSRLWSGLRMGMEQAASDLGAELRFLSPTSGTSSEQEELIQREAERGTDAMIVLPRDSEQLEQKIDFGEIPIISLESPLAGSRETVAPDHPQIGTQLAGLVVQEGAKQPVLLVSCYPKSSGVTQRVEAAQQALKKAGIQTILYYGDTFTQIEETANQQKAGQIVALDSKATLLLAEGYADSQSHPQVYGVGSVGEITTGLETGVLSAVAVWSEYAAGYMAVEYAVASAGRSTSRTEGTLRTSIIKEDEIYEPENQKLLFPIIS